MLLPLVLLVLVELLSLLVPDADDCERIASNRSCINWPMACGTLSELLALLVALVLLVLPSLLELLSLLALLSLPGCGKLMPIWFNASDTLCIRPPP